MAYELLEEIFRIYSPDPVAPFRFSQMTPGQPEVCAPWKSVLLQTPNLCISIAGPSNFTGLTAELIYPNCDFPSSFTEAFDSRE
jgi:hypothetical protein